MLVTHQHFLRFSHCFQKFSSQGVKSLKAKGEANCGCKSVHQFLTFQRPFLKQALFFTCLQFKSFEKIMGKGEIASNKQFLFFPQCFLSVSRTFRHFKEHEIVVCKVCRFGRVFNTCRLGKD